MVVDLLLSKALTITHLTHGPGLPGLLCPREPVWDVILPRSHLVRQVFLSSKIIDWLYVVDKST